MLRAVRHDAAHLLAGWSLTAACCGTALRRAHAAACAPPDGGQNASEHGLDASRRKRLLEVIIGSQAILVLQHSHWVLE